MYELPYGNTQQLNLDWFIKRWQEFYAQWQEAEAGIDHALDAEIQRVEDAMTDLYAARDAAAASATAAAASASSASNDATIATNAATAAAASATLANNKAAAAGLSEAAAANSANSASNSAIAASTSASQANASAASATASEQSATASATAAAGSASDAADSADDAADSATEAATSAQEAQDVLDSIPEDYSTLSADVVDLKADVAPIKQLAPLPIYPNDFLPDQDTTVHGRKFVRTENKVTINYSSSNSTGRYYLIYRNGSITYNTSLPNLRNEIAISTLIPNPKTVAMSMAIKITMHNKDGIARPFPPIHLIYESAVTAGTKYTSALFNDETEYVDASISLGFDLARRAGNSFGVAIWHSNSNIELKYEFLLYNDQAKTDAIDASIAKTQRNYIATENKSINDFVIISELLYRITSPVTAGETYIIGTNIERVYVCDILTQLLNS